MVLVTGIDLIEIRRVQAASERWGARFLQRVFTSAELEACAGRAESLAARLAAKEAAAKALGIGIRGLGAPPGAAPWHAIEVVTGERGQPSLRLHGVAAERAQMLGLSMFSLSLTHSADMAAAVVVGLGP